MATKSLSSPLALIKSGGVVIGKCKSVRITENLQRGRVKGIGEVNAKEQPVTDWSGSISISAFLVNFNDPLIPKTFTRKVQTSQQFFDEILLGEDDDITIDLIRKVKAGTNPQGLVIKGYELIASVSGIKLNKEGFDISEGQISGREIDGVYINPCIFPL